LDELTDNKQCQGAVLPFLLAVTPAQYATRIEAPIPPIPVTCSEMGGSAVRSWTI